MLEFVADQVPGFGPEEHVQGGGGPSHVQSWWEQTCLDRLPDRVQQGLTYLAPAVLGGIAAVELMSVVTAADPTGSALSVAAMALVAAVAYRFRNLSLTVLVGLIAVLALDLLAM